MSPEQLDEAKWHEAYTRAMKAYREGDPLRWEQAAVTIYRQLTIDNWTPPDPISPRVLAAREWLKGNHTAGVAPTIDRGEYDRNFEVSAFLAGFAAAVKLAEPLVARFIYQTERPGLVDHVNRKMITTYRQSIGDE